MTDAMGLQYVFGYDSDGNRTTAKDPMSRTTTVVFDALDRPSRGD